ncbi:autophagy-related protein 22-like protein [Rhexocercosporidium sp. MPI-PUGE-AT-0058]|nr:autophagy-related protein 22-like protein [Rhexocercosporidium sp. MPI-PUGE-AT-0058]
MARTRRRAPRYEGEDVSPTTSRELKGFYSYGLAAEVFAVCGVGSFLPVVLEQLARERVVLWSDNTTSCVVKPESGSHPVSVAGLLVRSDTGPDTNHQCVIPALGNMTTSSFALYTFSLAVFVQALSLVTFSAVADHGRYRKKFLVAFGVTGGLSSALFIVVVPQIFLVGSILAVIGVTCLGSSFVILNSFLPLLVANHPQVQGGTPGRTDDASTAAPHATSNGGTSSDSDEDVDPAGKLGSNETDSAALELSTKISSQGVGIGYIAAVFVQVLSIMLLFGMSKLSVSSTLPLRLVLFVVGCWWLGFTIPASIWLRDRPGPTCVAYISFSWASVWKTIKVAVRLRQMVIFLIAWFLLSDAIATVSGTAILFARTELKMGTVGIALLSITATSSGIAGAFTWPLISRHFKLKTNRTIVACIALMEIIPLYGLLSYIPLVNAWGVGGLQQSWEIYPLGFVHGFVMGGLSSYCRSFFGLLIPPGSEAAFYALYAITDKGSSAVGPAVVGAIVDATGQIRLAFVFLVVLIALPAPLILMVDAEKGRVDAARTAGVLQQGNEGESGVQNGTELNETEGLMADHD